MFTYINVAHGCTSGGVNKPDLIRKRFGYGQLWPLWPPSNRNRAGSDFPHPIWFRFSKESPDHIVQNRPGSDPHGLVRFWPNIRSGSKPVCRNHRARFLAERIQPVTSFPLLDSVVFFQKRLASYCAKPARIRFGSG